ncbi:hypothetical protein PHISCL_05166 [Aspergillus sclerotialis]|uniref:Altered inheritance of mitochondria protein 6 n=1 Tax=Aspergillus sclerotialis TaxID=2070753 RepID=A0A3A2ZIV9_9EURO|nr:hypothetical protein PHISCL_05166 [Aspergillus sclerotialis]
MATTANPPRGVSDHIETPFPDAYQPVPDCDYDPWLLEDHPLRTPPTECCPGASYLLRSCYHAAKRNWGGWMFRLVCFLLVLLVVLQSLAVIPYGISYIPKIWLEGDSFRFNVQTWLSFWPAEFQDRDQPFGCLLHSPRLHSDAIHLSRAVGCYGAKADIWLHNGQVLVGDSVRHLDEQYTLQRAYLDPLLRLFETRAPSSMVDGVVLSDEDQKQDYVLLLEFKTSMRALWPHLVAELQPLREAGHLTHSNGSQVFPGRLSVVVSGRASVDNLAPVDDTYNDIFFDGSLDELMLEDYESKSWSNNGLDSKVSAGGGISRHRSPNLGKIFCATTNFKESIGYPHRGRFSGHQIELIRAHVRAAHQRGIRVRYEDIPRRHRRVHDLIWRVLAREGVDLIDMEWDSG